MKIEFSKFSKSKTLICLAFFCYCTVTNAQLHVTRFAAFRTNSDTSTIGELFGKSGFAGELRRAVNQVTPHDVTNGEERNNAFSRDQAWIISYGGFLECYRFDSVCTISATFFHEVNANAMNDIGFNPRGVQWEERLEIRNLLYYHGFGTSVGFFHRCKHDIDNSDPEYRDTPNPDVIRKRGIILTGLSFSQSIAHGTTTILSSRFSIDSDIRFEYYLHANDYRFPETHFGNDWSNMKVAIQYLVRFSYPISNKIGLSLRLYLSGMYVGENVALKRNGGWVTNQRNEFLFNINQSNNTFSVVLVHEKLFDDVTRITADPTNVFSIGIRTLPSILY